MIKRIKNWYVQEAESTPMTFLIALTMLGVAIVLALVAAFIALWVNAPGVALVVALLGLPILGGIIYDVRHW